MVWCRCGAQNLFPVQIENVLTVHPEIREAAVVSVPDVKYGEVVGAWIVREGNESMSKEEVRRVVVEGMNPQVRRSTTARCCVSAADRGNLCGPIA